VRSQMPGKERLELVQVADKRSISAPRASCSPATAASRPRFDAVGSARRTTLSKQADADESSVR